VHVVLEERLVSKHCTGSLCKGFVGEYDDEHVKVRAKVWNVELNALSSTR
jgi:hypothetical protein